MACGVRLAKEAGDLSAFNSAENADDIEDLRAALGYDASTSTASRTAPSSASS